MEARLDCVTLVVAELHRARRFYSNGLRWTALDVGAAWRVGADGSDE